MRKVFINLTIVLMFLYAFLYVPFVEMQLYLFKHLYIDSRIILGVLLLLIIVDFLWINIFRNIEKLKCYPTVLLIMMVTALPILSLINKGSLGNWYLIFSRMYLYLIFILFFIVFKDEIEIKKLLKVILIIGIVNTLICLMQYAKNDILYPYHYYENGSEIFASIDFAVNEDYTCRSVGTLNSGYECGILLCFSIVYCLYNLINNNKWSKKLIYLLLVILLGLAGYTTFTRNIYLLMSYLCVMTIIYNLPLTERFKEIVFKSIPYIGFGLFIIIFIVCNDIGITNEYGISSTKTLVLRLTYWKDALILFINNPINALFGFAESQATGFMNDNIYIDCIYTFGVVGLVIFGYYWVKLTYRLYDASKKDKLLGYLCIFTSSIFVVGIFNLITSLYGLLAFAIPSALLYKTDRIG